MVRMPCLRQGVCGSVGPRIVRPALALVPHGSCFVLCLLFLLFLMQARTPHASLVYIHAIIHLPLLSSFISIIDQSMTRTTHHHRSHPHSSSTPSHRVRIPKQTLIQIHYSPAWANRIVHFWSKSLSTFALASHW